MQRNYIFHSKFYELPFNQIVFICIYTAFIVSTLLFIAWLSTRDPTSTLHIHQNRINSSALKKFKKLAERILTGVCYYPFLQVMIVIALLMAVLRLNPLKNKYLQRTSVMELLLLCSLTVLAEKLAIKLNFQCEILPHCWHYSYLWLMLLYWQSLLCCFKKQICQYSTTAVKKWWRRSDYPSKFYLG